MTIIFDFDGTLADSKQLLMKIGNQMAKEHGWPEINEAVFQHLRTGTIRGTLAFLDIPLRRLPMLFVEGRRRLRQHVPEIHIFPEMKEVVRQLHSRGHTLYVVSANEPAIISQVLAQAGLADYFTEVLHAPLWQKARVIKHLMHDRHLTPDDLWLIGDEQRDVRAAKRVGCHCIGVNWGLQDASVLKPLGPDAIAQKPQDILKVLEADS